MSLGTFLRDKRKAMRYPFPISKRVSLQDLAKLIPCTKSYLWDMEQGKSVPSFSMAIGIAKAYHTTLNQMAKELIKP